MAKSPFFEQPLTSIATTEALGAARQSRNSANALAHDLMDDLDELQTDLRKTQQQLVESERTRNELKEVLKNWMASQMAFKNLFRRFGVLPDGRAVSSISPDEFESLALAEKEQVAKTIKPF